MKEKQNQLLIALVCILFYPFSMKAQSYGTALGVRIADGFGITLQQQVAAHSTVEGILQSGFNKKDVTASVLFEQHNSLITRGLNFYLGGGLYKTWLEKDDNLITQPTNPFGISPIMGLELTLGKLNLSADFKPMIRLSGTGGKGFDWRTGVSVRYVLAGRFFKDEDWKFWKKWGKNKK